MAEENEGGERTEEATAQRREDFRRQGQVAQSREIASVLFLFACCLLLWVAGRFFMQQVLEMFSEVYQTKVVLAARDGDIQTAGHFVITKFLFLVVPFFGICLLTGVASSFLQVGFLSKEDALTPNLEVLDPIAGLRRLMSFRSVVEGAKSVLKLTVVMCVAYLAVRREIDTIPAVSTYTTIQLLTYISGVVLKLIFTTALLMIVISAIDYGYQRWELEKRMMMTKHEVKEEFKNREGDPQIKARIRRLQRDTARKRMMVDVPKADVIITNPTHIAVALQYSAELPAPRLIAAGAGVIAERIKKLAREHKIPVVENKPLARAIFSTLKIGDVIPRELYNAVAEVLAYVYKLKRKIRSI